MFQFYLWESELGPSASHITTKIILPEQNLVWDDTLARKMHVHIPYCIMQKLILKLQLHTMNSEQLYNFDKVLGRDRETDPEFQPPFGPSFRSAIQES